MIKHTGGGGCTCRPLLADSATTTTKKDPLFSSKKRKKDPLYARNLAELQPRPFVCKKIGQETIKVAHNVAKGALEAHFSFNFAFM